MPDDKFVTDVTAYLREEVPEVVEKASDEEIAALVKDAVKQAKGHGIDDDYCLRQFILFIAWCGPTFDQEPWAREILSDSSLAQETKIVRLEDHILSAEEEQ